MVEFLVEGRINGGTNGRDRDAFAFRNKAENATSVNTVGIRFVAVTGFDGLFDGLFWGAYAAGEEFGASGADRAQGAGGAAWVFGANKSGKVEEGLWNIEVSTCFWEDLVDGTSNFVIDRRLRVGDTKQ